MLAVQMDVYSAFHHYLAHAAVAAFDRRKPADARLREAIGILRTWNGQMEIDQAAPFLAELIFQHVRRIVAGAAAPKHATAYDSRMSTAVIERLLRERPEGWVKDWDEALLRALEEAVGEASRIQSRDPSRWRYGSYQTLHVRHPVGARVPWYVTQALKLWWLVTPWRGYENYSFDIAPSPMSGSATTVKAVGQRAIPSMRMIVDLADLERSFANIPTGQSGQMLSPHYKDQWESHYFGRSFPMQFRRAEVKDTLEFIP
jgi:penicillin amidase